MYPFQVETGSDEYAIVLTTTGPDRNPATDTPRHTDSVVVQAPIVADYRPTPTAGGTR